MMRFISVSICMLLICRLSQAQPNKSEIKIVAGYTQVTSVSQLLSSFGGKPVYVDLWATWCEPCKDEFKYSNDLYKAFNKRGIQMLYVSLHQNVTDADWRVNINQFQLKGSHVLASKALQDALTTLIWGGIDAFSIPHYLLFGADGKLLLIDALPPSSGQKLLDEVDEVIGK